MVQGRVAQPPKRSAHARASRRAAPSRWSWPPALASLALRIERFAGRWAERIAPLKPRYFGVAATALLMAASIGYGTVRGGHGPAIAEWLADSRDAVANAAGFRVASVAISGHRQLSEAQVLAAAGVTERTSLLFLDVEAARGKLEASSWIAKATVRKFYPGRLEISVEERDGFALWQHSGKLFIVAEDGTVLGPTGESGIPRLPLVVGPGAAPKARAFLALLDRYPELREQFRAAVLVAGRRWNLKLKSGLDVRLPETGIDQALDRLMVLDRDKKLLTRDLAAIDLRLPDRVTVRLSEEAAQARAEAAKEREKKKKKGGPA